MRETEIAFIDSNFDRDRYTDKLDNLALEHFPEIDGLSYRDEKLRLVISCPLEKIASFIEIAENFPLANFDRVEFPVHEGISHSYPISMVHSVVHLRQMTEKKEQIDQIWDRVS